jgi:uncharacterized Tic20 family protein
MTKTTNNVAEDSNKNLNNYKPLAVLVHFLGLFVSVITPLIILFISKDEQVKEHAKNALNWQISAVLYLFFSRFIISLYFPLIGALLTVALVILHFIFCVKAGMKASENIVWKPPLALPFF